MPRSSVADVKKISIEQLRPGMYVERLDCDWLSHPFFRNRFPVRDEDDVHKVIRSGVRELWIDTARGADVAEALTATEARERSTQALIEAVTSAPAPPLRTSFEAEFPVARRVHAEAERIMRGVLHDARLGRALDVGAIEPLVEQMNATLARNSGALLGLCRIKSADDYTFQHSVSVGALMMTFLRALGRSDDEVQEGGLAGLLHDIGKSRTPLAVLNKPGRLTDAEFAVMRSHPGDGLAILESTGGIGELPRTVCIQHHERIDGSGYPHGLAGGAISEIGQIAAIVDVYDAITSERCYHRGMAPTDALRKLYEWSRFHFNPTLVQAFTRCIGLYPVGVLVELESGRLAVVIGQAPDNVLTPTVRCVFDVRKRALLPAAVDLDLAAPGCADRILRPADPRAWGLEPREFLD